MKNWILSLALIILWPAVILSQAFAQQDIFKIKLEVKTEKDVLFLKEIGLDCPDKGECICEAAIGQMNKLRSAHYSYTILKQGIRIDKERTGTGMKVPSLDSIFGSNGNNYYIHDFDTTYSNINITGAPAQATVEGIDVHIDIIHSWVEDLIVDLTDQDVFYTYNLWDREGDGDTAIHCTETDIWWFNWEPVNQIWRLRVYDAALYDTGYIDYWSITIWYEAPSDLIVQSLTPSNYNPTVGEAINVAMVIKNQGENTAWGFWNDLFFNESSAPIPPASGDLYWNTSYLDPGETESHTFTEITSSDSGVWHMYGLTDSWAQVPEANENNNVKGPVDVHWHAPTLDPDLVIQSLTPSDYYPMAGESISVTLVIENLGNGDAGFFWTDLFFNLTSPPTVPSDGDSFWRTSLPAGETESHTFMNITSPTPGTWHMYGLTDSWGEISESSEDNNVKGPVNVYWQSTQEKPDLIVEDFCIGNNEPEVGDTVHVMVTIKNQGSVDVPYGFFSSLFYNRSSPPTPPDLGDDYFYCTPLAPGETFSYSFYIGNDVAEDWTMWFLVDSYASIAESDEDNNLYGPEYVSWFYPTKDSPITRDQIMSIAEDYANVTWECRAVNAASTPRCSAWSCDYEVDSTYAGVPYLWGGDRKVETFQNNLVNGFRAGAHDENDCLEGNAGLIGNACWATGIDCSGFVSRCWGLPKYGTWRLLEHSYEIRYDQLMRGDALDRPGHHVVLFSKGLPYDTLEIYEARDYGVSPPNPNWNLVQIRHYHKDDFSGNNYRAIHYNEITGDPPLLPGDANGNGSVDAADVVYIIGYLYLGGPPPNPLCIADVNDNGSVDAADAAYLLAYFYLGGPPPLDGCD